jgi:threonyl-tRNA synthetase
LRILAIHADSMSYRANRKSRLAEEIVEKEGSMEDCVVLLTSVEKLDEVDPGLVTDAARDEILARMDRLKSCRALLFPFAHLTSTLSSPEVALDTLKSLELKLKEAGIEVQRAPFGWYKEYCLKSKGHPMAELSMVICPYEGKSCDFHCPYCENPIRLLDTENAEAEHATPVMPCIRLEEYK